MFKQVLAFIARHQSFVLCTHDPADADGLGAELALACILREMGKEARIINASPVPHRFMFMDPDNTIETWDDDTHNLIMEKSALFILDTSDEYNIGNMQDILNRVPEIFVLDHHEPAPQSSLSGLNDSSAASASELIVEIAQTVRHSLDRQSAEAAYTGIVYDTGSFSYSKTSRRSLAAALKLVDLGVVPYQVYSNLNENTSTGALLLHKQVFSTLKILSKGRIAVQILRKEDLKNTGAHFEDAEHFINVPLKSKEIKVSLLIKENAEGRVRCSLRSKGTVNVSKIAQFFGGGGHAGAAGFKCQQNIEYTLNELHQIIEKIELQLEKLEKLEKNG
jgi:phosphoesterase RecJ-like protein